ncbi:MAG: DUF2520 domain-containing protein [Dehalococcoidales bacterium]|nr:DUF2520 domain-containing protein [Dehalococcoidales bacterium]
MQKLGFIGAGKVGTALAAKLSAGGYEVTSVYSRSPESAEQFASRIPGCRIVNSYQAVADRSDIIFITTPDDAIGKTVRKIEWSEGKSVVHCSGADSTAVLEPAKAAGAQTGAFHPLQTFAGVNEAIENLPGSTFAIEAEEPLLTELKKMATVLECRYIQLDAEDKVVYHAAAVMACNYLVTLIKQATDLWKTFDIPTQQATQALLPLIKGTIHNIETVGIPDCLTGPIARGDIGTIRKHIEALEKTAPDVLSTYLEMGVKTVPVALDKGKISENKAEEMAEILQQPNLLISI